MTMDPIDQKRLSRPRYSVKPWDTGFIPVRKRASLPRVRFAKSVKGTHRTSAARLVESGITSGLGLSKAMEAMGCKRDVKVWIQFLQAEFPGEKLEQIKAKVKAMKDAEKLKLRAEKVKDSKTVKEVAKKIQPND